MCGVGFETLGFPVLVLGWLCSGLARSVVVAVGPVPVGPISSLPPFHFVIASTRW